MIKLSLQDLLSVITNDGTYKQKFDVNNKLANCLDIIVDSIVVDSRKVKSNTVFVALPGQNSDGHAYLEQLDQDNCILAIVNTINKKVDIPQIVVEDSKYVLGLLSKYINSKLNSLVVAITGSNGKTTTKFILNSILKQYGKVFCAQDSYNNDIGVPLTMFTAEEDDWAGIFEVGTNHPGEIEYLASLISSDIAMLLNVSDAHIGNFENSNAILLEKSNLFNSLKPESTAIIPSDLVNKDYVVDLIETQNLKYNKWSSLKTFGFDSSADCYADQIEVTPVGSTFRINIDNNKIDAVLNLLGEHQIKNALAASLAAYELGIDLDLIKTGLAEIKPITKRMQSKELANKVYMIDDSYNASPASMKAAIEFLSGLPGNKVLVLGDLGELGEHSIQSHKDIGILAKQLNIDKLLAIGDFSKYTLEAFYGDSSEEAKLYKNKSDLVEYLLKYLSKCSNLPEQCTILIKGSNFMRMWEVGEELVNKFSTSFSDIA